MSPAARLPVMLLPGGFLPAGQAYTDLIAALGPDVDAVAKDLEVYSRDEPPADYELDREVEGLLREARARGFERFHLVGYSGGGAVALAFVSRHADRVLSLALLEPAWAGNEGLGEEEQQARSQFDEIMQLPAPERMAAFVRAQLRPGVEPPPPPSESPPWMARRPAGLAALASAFAAYHLDMDALQAFPGPVLYVLGALSNPALFERQAERLSRTFADLRVEVFADRHHFDPPHRKEPERLAHSLRSLWNRATGT